MRMGSSSSKYGGSIMGSPGVRGVIPEKSKSCCLNVPNLQLFACACMVFPPPNGRRSNMLLSAFRHK